MADAGRVPGPTVEEKVPLAARDAGAVGRDMVEDEYEFPRLCALVVVLGCRVTDPGLFVSGFAVFGRVGDMLRALFAIVPGAMIPERELVVAEVASRRPACGRRVRVDDLVLVMFSPSILGFVDRQVTGE